MRIVRTIPVLHAGCGGVPDTFHIAARQCGASVAQLGSLFFEEMSCAGYDPQRRQFAAPVKIKQPFGFGGTPLPGSREYVLHCVADSAGVFLPVGRDSVHLADAPGQQPTWQFAVIVNAIENLHTIYPMSGQTRRARSILSRGRASADERLRFGELLEVLAADEAGVHVPLCI